MEAASGILTHSQKTNFSIQVASEERWSSLEMTIGTRNEPGRRVKWCRKRPSNMSVEGGMDWEEIGERTRQTWELQRLEDWETWSPTGQLKIPTKVLNFAYWIKLTSQTSCCGIFVDYLLVWYQSVTSHKWLQSLYAQLSVPVLGAEEERRLQREVHPYTCAHAQFFFLFALPSLWKHRLIKPIFRALN